MKEYNIKSDLPIVEIALKRLSACLQEARFQNLKIIKIIHGYGSSGVGGEIKTALLQDLQNKMKTNKIKAYIPGESMRELLGFDTYINQFRHLLNGDVDLETGNKGITYIIL